MQAQVKYNYTKILILIIIININIIIIIIITLINNHKQNFIIIAVIHYYEAAICKTTKTKILLL